MWRTRGGDAAAEDFFLKKRKEKEILYSSATSKASLCVLYWDTERKKKKEREKEKNRLFFALAPLTLQCGAALVASVRSWKRGDFSSSLLLL